MVRRTAAAATRPLPRQQARGRHGRRWQDRHTLVRARGQGLGACWRRRADVTVPLARGAAAKDGDADGALAQLPQRAVASRQADAPPLVAARTAEAATAPAGALRVPGLPATTSARWDRHRAVRRRSGRRSASTCNSTGSRWRTTSTRRRWRCPRSTSTARPSRWRGTRVPRQQRLRAGGHDQLPARVAGLTRQYPSGNASVPVTGVSSPGRAFCGWAEALPRPSVAVRRAAGDAASLPVGATATRASGCVSCGGATPRRPTRRPSPRGEPARAGGPHRQRVAVHRLRVRRRPHALRPAPRRIVLPAARRERLPELVLARRTTRSGRRRRPARPAQVLPDDASYGAPRPSSAARTIGSRAAAAAAATVAAAAGSVGLLLRLVRLLPRMDRPRRRRADVGDRTCTPSPRRTSRPSAGSSAPPSSNRIKPTGATAHTTAEVAPMFASPASSSAPSPVFLRRRVTAHAAQQLDAGREGWFTGKLHDVSIGS